MRRNKTERLELSRSGIDSLKIKRNEVKCDEKKHSTCFGWVGVGMAEKVGIGWKRVEKSGKGLNRIEWDRKGWKMMERSVKE